MKQYTVIIILLLCSINAKAKQVKASKTRRISNTTISLFESFNRASYKFSKEEGDLALVKNSSKWGIGIARNYYVLNNKYFVTVGFNYQLANLQITASTTVPGFDRDNSYNRYTINQEFFVIPIYFGKTIKLDDKSSAYIDVFGGLSLGITDRGSLKEETSLRKSENNDDVIGITPPTNPFDLGGEKFYTSFDLGFKGTPFNLPNLSIGATASLSLTKTESFGDEGNFGNITQGVFENYKFNFTNRFLSLRLHANYTFGKRWKKMLKN